MEEAKQVVQTKLALPKVVYVDFTDDPGHMHAHESYDHCNPHALVGRYRLMDLVFPSERPHSEA
jgi:hypothetical protein